MKTISVDLRQRIVTAYDKGDTTREQVAQRFGVSLGLVKKLLQQRRHIGDLQPRHHRSGRKPLFTPRHRRQLTGLLKKDPDLTLRELREALKLSCSLPAIFYVLEDLGLTYKKRHSMPANRAGRTSRGAEGSGGGAKKTGTLRG